MIEQVRSAYKLLLVMGAGAILLMLSMFVPVLSSNADFSIYNTDWNGCSSLGRTAYRTGTFLPTIDISRSSKETVVHGSFTDMEGRLEPSKSALMIIGPDLPFTRQEGDFVHRFLLAGGRVLLADDVGSGSGLLSFLNTSTTITGSRLLDLSFMKTGDFSVTTGISDHRITEDVEMLLLNFPSTVSPSPYAKVLVNSSSASWTDLDGDDVKDTDEAQGPFPILTLEPYGKGELIVLSEPSILINQMQGKMNDSLLSDNLIGYLTEGREALFIDETHRDLANPVHVMNVYVASIDPKGKVGIALGTLAAMLIVNTPLPARTRSFMERLLKRLFGEEVPRQRTVREVFEEALRKHPEWDAATVRRIRDSIEAIP